MADQEHHHEQVPQVECETAPSAVETQDRGLFDFIGKKEEEKPKPVEAEEVVIATEFEKVHVSEPKEEKKEEEKKHGLLEKLHSASSSSSSSDEEEEGEGGEKKKKKKKGLKEKIKEKIAGEETKPEAEDTTVPVEKYEEPVCAEPNVQPEEKKGFLDKIKEKLPGHQKPEEVPLPPPPPPAAECVGAEEPKEKKGILEKIKEKLPGYHPKTEEEKEKECGSN